MSVLDYSLRRRVAALEAALSGGSTGSFSTNAVELNVALPALNGANGWWHECVEADLSIQAQHGTDLSIGTSPRSDKACIFSAAGGVFQAVAYISPQEFGGAAVVLDAGSSKQRFAWVGAVVGSSGHPFGGLGFDLQVPVVPGAGDPNGINQAIAISTPGSVAPGDPVLDRISFSAIQPFGTDSITLGASVGVWQVA